MRTDSNGRDRAKIVWVACWLTLVAAQTYAESPDYTRPGFEVRAGAALGFENSSTLDLVNLLLLPQLNATLPGTPGLPPGTTALSAQIEASTMAGVSLAAGYRVHPHLAIEGAFEWVTGDLDVSAVLSAPSVGVVPVDQRLGGWDAWAVGANLKAYALTGRFQPYALVGLGALGQEISDDFGAGLAASATAFLPRFGGGFDVYLTEHVLFDANVQYLFGTGDLDGNDLILLRLALGFRF